jgi:hypothetical protein
LSEEAGCLKVNLDHKVKLLIREADCLAKMGVPMPVVTRTLLCKRDHFILVGDSLQVSLSHISVTRSCLWYNNTATSFLDVIHHNCYSKHFGEWTLSWTEIEIRTVNV